MLPQVASGVLGSRLVAFLFTINLQAFCVSGTQNPSNAKYYFADVALDRLTAGRIYQICVGMSYPAFHPIWEG